MVMAVTGLVRLLYSHNDKVVCIQKEDKNGKQQYMSEVIIRMIHIPASLFPVDTFWAKFDEYVLIPGDICLKAKTQKAPF